MYRKLASSLIFALFFSIAAFCAQPPAPPTSVTPQIKGQYLETRSADVYVGQCFANGEMNTAGQEAIVAWHIGEGKWDGSAQCMAYSTQVKEAGRGRSGSLRRT